MRASCIMTTSVAKNCITFSLLLRTNSPCTLRSSSSSFYISTKTCHHCSTYGYAVQGRQDEVQIARYQSLDVLRHKITVFDSSVQLLVFQNCISFSQYPSALPWSSTFNSKKSPKSLCLRSFHKSSKLEHSLSKLALLRLFRLLLSPLLRQLVFLIRVLRECIFDGKHCVCIF